MKKVQKILKVLFSRMVIVGLLLAVQFGIIVFGIWQLADYFYYLYAAFFVISIAAVLWIMSRQDNPAYKLAWVIPILLFPAFGGLFYLFFGTNKVSKKFRRRIELAEKESAHLLVQDETVMKEIEQDSMNTARQVAYIRRRCMFPVYKNACLKPCAAPSTLFFWNTSSSRRGKCGTPSSTCCGRRCATALRSA